MTGRSITSGERRVLQAYVDLETHAEAAASLGISPQTLKNHLGSIYKKLGVRKAHSAIYKLALLTGCDPIQQAGNLTDLTQGDRDAQNDVDEAAEQR